MSGSLDLLLLDPELDNLLLLELFKLLLLRDQEMLLVSPGLLGDSVEHGGDGFVVDDVGGQSSR